MKIDFNSIKPIYIQIADAIEDDIIMGRLNENEPVYSQLVLSKELGVNPATAAKGINVLVQKGILEKQRGLSMVVAVGAKGRLMDEKRKNSFTPLVRELVNEAKKISLSEEELIDVIKNLYSERSSSDE